MAISLTTGNQVGIGDCIFRLGLMLPYLERIGETLVFLQGAFNKYKEMNILPTNKWSTHTSDIAGSAPQSAPQKL